MPLTDKLNTLKELQKETGGASFSITFSTKRGLWSVRLVNQKKAFEGNPLAKQIDLAISYIKENRKGKFFRYSLFEKDQNE